MKQHWEHVYSTKRTDEVSWFQEHLGLSLRLIQGASVPLSASIIDVGGGGSTLIEDLLSLGYASLTVLDISKAALAAARARLGADANAVQWIETDITKATLPLHGYDVWHDRAVFHFLADPQDRRSYVHALYRALKPGGYLIVAAFAEDGPSQCSGLPVVRYSAQQMHAEFGESFMLLKHDKEAHRTPFGAVQQFVYCCFRKAMP